MNLVPRIVLAATPVAAVLTLALAIGASAQVATLGSPEETAIPEGQTTETAFEFEDREEAILAYAQCMRDNGIDMDDPTFDESGGGRVFGLGGGPGRREVDRFGEGFGEAQEACGDILAAAAPEIDPVAEQERLEEQLLLSQCIRDNGYPEYPDPVIGTNGRLQRAGGQDVQELGIDPRSTEFRELMTTCRDEIGLDAFGPGGGRGRQS